LQQTRYKHGQVDWALRLHYFTDWLRHNQRRGAIRIRSKGTGSKIIEARMSFVEQLPEQRARFHAVPKQRLKQAWKRFCPGTITAFASVRAKLDFFHVGLVFPDTVQPEKTEQATLIHASRSTGRVVAQPLVEFLKHNRMRGMAFASPVEDGVHS
jgi:hypothetical protein